MNSLMRILDRDRNGKVRFFLILVMIRLDLIACTIGALVAFTRLLLTIRYFMLLLDLT